jgi:glycosyltransferase involved in cell wall biosynthesis
MGESIHICFIAHLAYGAMNGGSSGHIGGIERQMSLMARWCVRQGNQVSMLTWDEGQEDGTEIGGVKVFKMCRSKAGVPGLRFFWPRWSSLNAAMKRADADVYYQNCGEYVTGQAALWCRWHNREFVYSVASDPDCDGRLPEMHKFRERVLFRYGLKHADRVIVQTRRQQEMLLEGFGRDSVVVPMPCPGPSKAEYGESARKHNGSQRVLWIGRICEVKRPDRFLDLAQACPGVQFDFVGPVGDSQYARSVYERARTLANVNVRGPALHDRVSDFYRQAKVMCCTSDFEGFPNTFLEAWSWGVPIVSTFDPDHLIEEKGLGRVGKDVSQLAVGIREMLNAPDQWQAASRAARDYYLANHSIDQAMERFERVFVELARLREHRPTRRFGHSKSTSDRKVTS